MTESTAIVAGAVVYLAVVLSVGLYASRRIKDGADFIVAGRRLPLWLCLFTVFSTWFGSGTLIGAAGAAYERGLSGILSNPVGSALCLVLAGLFYVRMLRRLRLLTLPDLFGRRFGRTAEVLCAICTIPAYVGWVASIFVAAGYVLHTIAGMNTTQAIILSAAVTVAYTFAGGMWAVSLTDFAQALVIIVGLLILAPSVLGDVGGLAALARSAPAGHFDVLPGASVKEWTWFVQALLVIGLGNIASQDLLQRAFSARDEWVAQWSMYLAAVLYSTVAALPIIFGIAGRVLMPDLPDPEFVLPALGKAYLPPVALAIFVGALFSALMSSADGGMLAPASIFGQNVLKVLKPGLTERQLLWSIRWGIVVVGLAALLTALHFQNVYQLMVKSFSVLFVGLIAPMTAALYWRRCNGPAAVASIVTGVVSWLALEVAGISYPPDLIAAGVGVLVLFGVTLATGRRSPPRPLIDMDGAAVTLGDRLGTFGVAPPQRD